MEIYETVSEIHDPYLKRRLNARMAVPYGGLYQIDLPERGLVGSGTTFESLVERIRADRRNQGIPFTPEIEAELEQEICRRYPEESVVSRETGAPRPPAARLYDGFMFFNEFELLKLRCEELKPLQPTHILVESPWTVQGRPKPLYFAERQREFAEYNIVHKVLENPPNNGDSWANERAQRNYIWDERIRDGDLLVLTDADEIPRAQAIQSWYGDCASLLMTGCQYFLNRKPHEGFWTKPKIMRGGYVKGQELFHIRLAGHDDSVSNGGWHFSWMGGLERIIAKLESFSHAEMNTPAWHDRELWQRKFGEEPFVPLDETYPRYLLENRSQFEHLIHL